MHDAVDVLRVHADVDAERIAYQGISYGGAMGALFVGIERRIRAAALVVGDGGLVSHFTGPEDMNFMAGLSCATRVDWLRAMTPIEPIRFIAHASPTALLLQNGRLDNLVPTADAQALHTAAPQPKTIRWYGRATESINRRRSIGWLGCASRLVSTPGNSTKHSGCTCLSTTSNDRPTDFGPRRR